MGLVPQVPCCPTAFDVSRAFDRMAVVSVDSKDMFGPCSGRAVAV